MFTEDEIAYRRAERDSQQVGSAPSCVARWTRLLLGLRPWVGGGVLAAAWFLASSTSALAKGSATTSSAVVVNPGTGIAPPGSAQLTTILSYLAWGVTATCVAGVLIVASKMALATRGHQGGSEHAGALGWVLVAAVVAGSASALVGALI